MFVPEISNNVIVLNRFQFSDWNDHFLHEDDVMRKWLQNDEKSTEDNVKKAIRKWHQSWREKSKLKAFAIREKDSNNLVGGLELRIGEEQRAQCSYWIFQSFRGKNYASQALRLMSTHAFNHLNIRRIEAYIDVDNIGSQKTIIKAGFKQEGRLRSYSLHNHDVFLFSKLSSDNF